MPNEPLPDDPLRIWQDQPVENTLMSLEEIRRKARAFEKRIRNRNRREYAAAIFVVIAFTYYIFKFSDPLVRVGSALVIAGTLYVVYQLYSRASAKTVPADLGLTGSLEFHRRELVRQRDMVESVWSWYLAPFVPGLLVFMKGVSPKRGPGFVLALGFQALVFGAIWWLNRRAAARLTRQIAELDNLGSQP
jgi:hypothetical protein